MIQIDLSNQKALITGATGNLGRVMAITLAKAGADIVIHYHSNNQKAIELKAEIEAMGRNALIVQGDITNESSVMAMKDQIQQQWGSLQIIIANAVIQYPWMKILDQPLEDFQSQFDSCVLQSVLLAKAFMTDMIEAKSGRFIGINTECAIQTFETQGAYAAGKKGMDGLYRVLAKEVGEYGITVNQVAPGWTISDLDLGKSVDDNAYCEKVPLKRRGTDQEIANMVCFLASPLASFTTGAYIPVSGGNVLPGI